MGATKSVLSNESLQNARKLHEKYHIQKVKLGSGSFGTVWRAVHKETQTKVAMKVLDRRKMRSGGGTDSDLIREIEILHELQLCVNVTDLYDAFQDDDNFYLALEYCEWGDFGDKLRERGSSLEEWEAADWMAQIVNAIAHLHDRKIIHRDVKPDNFLVGKGSYGSNDTLKLADFGLAAKLRYVQTKFFQKCGTPAFMAPEQHLLPRSGGYGLPVDVWAAGVCMWSILHAGDHPFVEERALRMPDLLKGKPPFRKGFWGKRKWSDLAEKLCNRILHTDADERPKIVAVARDIWFKYCQNERDQRQEARPASWESELRRSSAVTLSGPTLQSTNVLQRENEGLRDKLRRAAEKQNTNQRKIEDLEDQLTRGRAVSLASATPTPSQKRLDWMRRRTLPS